MKRERMTRAGGKCQLERTERNNRADHGGRISTPTLPEGHQKRTARTAAPILHCKERSTSKNHHSIKADSVTAQPGGKQDKTIERGGGKTGRWRKVTRQDKENRQEQDISSLRLNQTNLAKPASNKCSDMREIGTEG